jgi:DNA repair exonuclease SbcCD ATPase subunit
VKIVKLQAENIKKLKAVEIAPAGNVVKITGACEQGKTTVLDAIMYALGGGDKLPGQPIRQGADKGQITLDLGDMIVTRTFTAGNSYVKIENKDGFKAPSPQALLDKLIGKLTFDPRVFARADAKTQVDMLLKVVDLKIDPAKIYELAGQEFRIDDPLQALNFAYKTVFDSRTAVNRDLDTAKKALASMPAVEKTEPVSLAELVAEKERLEAINRDNQAQIDAAAEQGRKVRQLASERDAIASEVERIKSTLAEAEKRLAAKTKEHDAAERERVQMQVIANGIHFENLTDINTRIQNADETNKKARQYEERQAKTQEVASHQAKADDLTKKLDAIKAYKEQIVAETKFPVDGLNFAGGGVTYKGLPFEQASSAEKIRVSLAIGMALNPKLKVVLIDGGEALDSKQMAIIEQMAAEHDFQVWITSVDESGKVGIYIEDGEVKAVNE